MSARLAHGAVTDVGLLRERNEDAMLVAPPVFVVADGMGGHAGGDVASRLAVEEFRALAQAGYDPDGAERAVRDALDRAHRRLRDYAAAHGRRDWYSGTTVVAALPATVRLGDERTEGWLVMNLGDSRAYRFVAGRLEQVSHDHSVVQTLLDAGLIGPDDVATHPERNVITKALGSLEDPDPDFFSLPLTGRLLLCTDGVSGLLDEDEIARTLAESADPQHAAERLVAAALAAGGHDNATALVVDVLDT